MNDDKWLPAARALELLASRFAAAKKQDAVLVHEEAKTAIIGDLASGRLHSCPKRCLNSAFKAEAGRPSDFKFCELDADGNSFPLSMSVQHEGEYVFVPQEFWENFRDPAAGASSNWHGGHFSFRLVTALQATVVGEVRELFFDRASIEQIGTIESDTDAVTRTGDPGRPEKGYTLYIAELERRRQRGDTLPTLAQEAEALLSWLRQTNSLKSAPTAKTIENRIRENYRKAALSTK